MSTGQDESKGDGGGDEGDFGQGSGDEGDVVNEGTWAVLAEDGKD